MTIGYCRTICGMSTPFLVARERPGVLEGVVAAIRGRDRSQPVTFGNIFNQVHAATQVVAAGTTQYDDGVIRVSTDKTHGLYSEFEWVVEPA